MNSNYLFAASRCIHFSVKWVVELKYWCNVDELPQDDGPTSCHVEMATRVREMRPALNLLGIKSLVAVNKIENELNLLFAAMGAAGNSYCGDSAEYPPSQR